MQKITTFLWFDKEAVEAAKFYCSIFKKSKILGTTRQFEGVPGSTADVLTVEFRLGDQEFVALNGGPTFKFTEAISLMINCKDQKEVDYYWEKLLAGGGKPVQCGWLKDRFGLSWQVTPADFGRLYKNPKTAPRVMQAMLGMRKIDVAGLEKAAAGR